MIRDRTLQIAAIAVAAGAAASGPLGLALTALHPQPPWRDAATFLAHFHRVQTAPYWLGFALLVPAVAFVVRAASLQRSSRGLAATVAATVYATMIGINYTLQTAFVPALAEARDPLVAHFTMANPGSLAWALEMFGYGALGVATWLVAPLFEGHAFRRQCIRALFAANGVLSIAGALVTAVDLRWVMTPAGLAAFAIWNVLVIAAMALVAVDQAPERVTA